MNSNSNIKLSREQQAVQNARMKYLNTVIENNRIQSKTNKNADMGIMPERVDSRSFAEIQTDEVLIKERLLDYCKKLLSSSNLESNKLVQLLSNNPDIRNYFLENYSKIFREVNSKLGVETAKESFSIIKDMYEGVDTLLKNKAYIDGNASILGALERMIDKLENIVSETKDNSKEQKKLVDLVYKLDALSSVVSSDAGSSEKIIDLLDDLPDLESSIDTGGNIEIPDSINDLKAKNFNDWFESILNDMTNNTNEDFEYNQIDYDNTEELNDFEENPNLSQNDEEIITNVQDAIDILEEEDDPELEDFIFKLDAYLDAVEKTGVLPESNNDFGLPDRENLNEISQIIKDGLPLTDQMFEENNIDGITRDILEDFLDEYLNETLTEDVGNINNLSQSDWAQMLQNTMDESGGFGLTKIDERKAASLARPRMKALNDIFQLDIKNNKIMTPEHKNWLLNRTTTSMPTSYLESVMKTGELTIKGSKNKKDFNYNFNIE